MSVTDQVAGRLGENDVDLFRVTVTEEPGLWQLDVTGSGLGRVTWIAADGSERAVVPSTDGTSATMTDLYLIPGDHWFGIEGTAGAEYGFAFTALGPRDPESELEPNEAMHAEAIHVGSTRTGRLPDPADVDVYRFTLDVRDHVLLTLTPPADGVARLQIATADGAPSWFTDITGGSPGDPITWDGLLQPDDYEAWLTPVAASAEHYRFSLERDDPFTTRIDQEPNDSRMFASALPASLHIEGEGRPGGEMDWFAIGALPNGGDLAIRTTGSVEGVVVTGDLAVGDQTIEHSEDGTIVASGLPAGVPLWLQIDASGPYSVDLDPGTTGLGPAVAPPPPLEASLTVSASPDVVGAYRTVGQAVAGKATVTNAGSTALSLTLDTVTSDHRWTAIPETTSVAIPAGSTVDVPLDIRVQPDAGADQAVRLTVRARDAAGAQVTGSVDLRADRTIEAVNPLRVWTVPDALLGGLNVAATALGGTLVASSNPDVEGQLVDGQTLPQNGYGGYLQGGSVTFTVDLAGEMAVPIAGTILNPLAGGTSMGPSSYLGTATFPRAFTLLVSDDGSIWQEAFHGELTPADRDQPFVLTEPVLARFAQLRIESTWGSVEGGPAPPVALGEWKVVAVPGAVPEPMPRNIAEPARGGHVVWMTPQVEAQSDADIMLSDDPADRWIEVQAAPGDRFRWVIGFQDDRAALIDHLEWEDLASTTDESRRLQRLDVEIATTSPIGPWSSIGTWRLDRSADGSIAPFPMSEDAWVRFIRFTSSPVRKDTDAIDLPAALRVIEHATDDRYWSILGEWGDATSQGPRELFEPADQLPPMVEADLDDDTPDRAQSLSAETIARDRVLRNEDEDWYLVAIPEGHNSITLTAGGDPSVGVALAMFDDAGQPVAMTFRPGTVPGTTEYRANVTAGAPYRVRVEQPPFSLVLTYDTSNSMVSYHPMVFEALRTYTGGIVPGEEQALVIPFLESPLLKDWSDDAYRLQDAVNRFVPGDGSSAAEASLLMAAQALAGREGTRAVLIITDAQSPSYQDTQKLWQELDRVRPMVFTVHVGTYYLGPLTADPRESRHMMQDWAMAGFGHYQYAGASYGDMGRAFDRMATWLRRPAAYSLRYQTAAVKVPPPTPGTLRVVAPKQADGTTSAVIGKGVAIEIILDTSGTMRQRFGGRSRVEIAKDVLTDLVEKRLPAGTPVALRVFGSRRQPCATRLAVPLGPLDPGAVTALVDPIRVDQESDTPIGAALREVPSDLAGDATVRLVVLITDSEERWPHPDLCGVHPDDAVRELRAAGIEARINVVGLAVTDKRARSQLVRWARLGGGSYFDARKPEQFQRAVLTAVSAPFEVYDVTGTLVASGTVGAEAVSLPSGTYRLVVLTNPEMVYEGVIVEPGQSLVVTLPSGGQNPVAPEEPVVSPSPGTPPGG
jgi:hypothetical protein